MLPSSRSRRGGREHNSAVSLRSKLGSQIRSCNGTNRSKAVDLPGPWMHRRSTFARFCLLMSGKGTRQAV